MKLSKLRPNASNIKKTEPPNNHHFIGFRITNIPRNFIMALPLQLLIAGPFIRGLFRKLFPEGTVLA